MDYLEFDDVNIEPVESESAFDFIEFDQPKRVLPGKKDYIRCDNCGSLNPPGSDFCIGCQMELITFRKVELDTGPVRVKLKFPKNKKYVFCPVCGAPNPKNSRYCKDCMSGL